jgi:hypothetical protein
MPYRQWIPWTPGRHDTGLADESTREHAVFGLFTPGHASGGDYEEKCRRAIRATELERVAAETRRAAVALAADEWSPTDRESFDPIHRKMLSSRLTTTIAALNLMGIQTVLPGEQPFDAAVDLPAGTCIYLREPLSHDDDAPDIVDGLDALSGLIGDFKRSTILISGIRIQPRRVAGAEFLALVAAHRAIMAVFGEFLARKYIMEGWSLV